MKTKTILILTLVFYTVTAFSILRAGEKYSPLEIDYSIKDVSCYDRTDGKIDIFIKGGKAPYIIVWDNGLSNLSLENLRVGEYSVKVCDARGKMITQYFCIDAPKPISINMTAELSTKLDFLNAKSNVQVEGGTPWKLEEQEHYFFRLNGIANYNDSISIESGIYNLTVEDSKGCKTNKEIFLENLSPGESKENNKHHDLPVLKIRKNQMIRQLALTDIN